MGGLTTDEDEDEGELARSATVFPVQHTIRRALAGRRTGKTEERERTVTALGLEKASIFMFGRQTQGESIYKWFY